MQHFSLLLSRLLEDGPFCSRLCSASAAIVDDDAVGSAIVRQDGSTTKVVDHIILCERKSSDTIISWRAK